VKSTAENPLISYRGSRPMACMSRSLIAKANGNFTMISPNGSCCALPLFPLQVAKMKKQVSFAVMQLQPRVRRGVAPLWRSHA